MSLFQIIFIVGGTFLIIHIIILFFIGFNFIKLYWKTLFSKNIFMALLMPTLIYAKYQKDKLNDKDKITNFIKDINKSNLTIAIMIFILLGLLDFYKILNYIQNNGLLKTIFIIFGYMIIWATISRSLEIFYAFYKDSISQLSIEKNNSHLKYYERIQLAMRSYIELILNYAIFYFVYINLISLYDIDISSILPEFKIYNIIDSFYYSIVTITTLGYGDIHPNSNIYSIPIKLVSSFQVINGFILIIVSFTIYVSKSLEAKEYKNNQSSTDSKIYTVTIYKEK